MADIKRRVLSFSSGRQIKLYGNSMSIASSLEIGEGAAPNILSFWEQIVEQKPELPPIDLLSESKTKKVKAPAKAIATVQNPHQLTEAELMELADFNIRLWMELKDNIRRYGLQNPKIFNREQ